MALFFPVGDVQCFGKDCYALAFGVPGVLMLIALGKCSGARKLITTDAFHVESMSKHYTQTILFSPHTSLLGVIVGVFPRNYR